MRPLAALCLFVATPAVAAPVALCNPAHPQIPGFVTHFESSADTSVYLANPDAIVFDTAPEQANLSSVTASGFPGGLWKCSAGAIVVPAQSEIDAYNAAQATAQAAAVRASILDWLREVAKEVADGEFLRRVGNDVKGSPPLPVGAFDVRASPVTLSGTEQALVSLPIAVAAGERIAIWGRCQYVKDGGTTVRTVTSGIRRGAGGPLIGEPFTARSQGVASSDFGPGVHMAVDITPGTGPVTYVLGATSPAGSPQATRCELLAMRVE